MFLDTFFNADVAARYLPDILHGMWVTLQLGVAVIVTGILLGLALAMLRSVRLRPVNVLIVIFVDVFRAVPPLVFILIIFYGLPNVGILIPAFATLWLTLSFVLAAFAEEIFWAGIIAVPNGQWEAGRSTGLTRGQTLGYVVVPQAVRMSIPPLTNRTLAITKNTALGTVIGVSEILGEATSAQSFSGNATPLLMGAAAYLAVFLPMVIAARWLETRFVWGRA